MLKKDVDGIQSIGYLYTRKRKRTQNKMTATTKIEVGTQVERIASDYTNGRKGEVIEINEGRARVRWNDSPRKPPFPRPPVRPHGCSRGLPPKANS